ncbi:unnamed protein product [Lactuca virosa]|uniref:Uncharacterized protein n=1 Tax=Lactuca virosa TaxID=75947 RepID=A0AAU9PMF6_9ASTR|nr:unnamed protein product [Lactuca virosa]
MLKLFSRRRHDLHNQNRPPILFIFYHLTKFHFEDDPHFFPILKTINPQNQNNKKLKGNASNNKPRNEFSIKPILPFDLRYSYSETNPSVEPIGYRETPKFSHFGPGRLERAWTGMVAPLQQTINIAKVEEERNVVLGSPLSDEEVSELVERYRHSDCSRQINLVINHIFTTKLM